MSIIIVALIIVFVVIGASTIFVYKHIRNLRNKKEKLLSYVSKIGSQQRLFFARQEELLNSIIALDRLQRKLLIIEENNGRYYWKIIALEEVENCTLKKVYDSIDAGGLKAKRVEGYLRTIALQLNFNNDKPSFDLIFYENTVNNIYEMSELENKARKWQAMLSKIIVKQAELIA
jgi:hypothetical protein